MSEFDRVWQRITALAGETFHQKMGKAFTYSVVGNTVRPGGVDRQLPRSQFARAYELFPVDGPGRLNHLQGPSYLFAILSDPRVAAGVTESRAADVVQRHFPPAKTAPAWPRSRQQTLATRKGQTAVRALREVDPDQVLLVTTCSAAKARGGRPASSVAAAPPWSEALLATRARVLAGAGVDRGTTLPAWQRYTGSFYRQAIPALSGAATSGRMIIISGGYGVVRADEPINWYDKVLRLADWPSGLLESALISEARRVSMPHVVVFAAATSEYTRLVRRTRWRQANVRAHLVTIEGISRGAMGEVPRLLGQAFNAFWGRQESLFPAQAVVESLS